MLLCLIRIDSARCQTKVYSKRSERERRTKQVSAASERRTKQVNAASERRTKHVDETQRARGGKVRTKKIWFNVKLFGYIRGYRIIILKKQAVRVCMYRVSVLFIKRK